MDSKFNIGDKVFLKKKYNTITSWLVAGTIYTIDHIKYSESTDTHLVFFEELGSDVGTYEYRLELHKKAKNKKTLTLVEQIRLAKSLIGKRIKSRISNTYGKVSGFDMFTSLDEFDNKNTSNLKEVAETFKDQGAIIVLKGNWEDGHIIEYPIYNDADLTPETKPEVIINGYVGVDEGHYFKFGCAEISKELLKKAKTFLDNINSDEDPDFYSNRTINSVKIGSGDFTLEDINNLLS